MSSNAFGGGAIHLLVTLCPKLGDQPEYGLEPGYPLSPCEEERENPRIILILFSRCSQREREKRKPVVEKREQG
jgi:hypothetical protein